jgi:cell division septum initiation protein DivIVA
MREFLRGLDLEDSVIDSIMAEHGKHMQKFKEENEDLKTQYQELLEKTEYYGDIIDDLSQQIESNDTKLKDYDTITNENKDLKAQIQMSDSNVKKEFSKFVTSEVQSRVNDDVDFETALNDYKKENPQYFGETIIKTTQSSPVLSGGEAKPITTNDIMNNILRGEMED